MKWGYKGSYVNGLSNIQTVVTYGSTNQPIQSELTPLYKGYFPIQCKNIETNYKCPTDKNAKYPNKFTSDHGYIPSPYLNDGSCNNVYFTTEFTNCLADVNGKNNSEKLWASNGQPEWKTDETIEDNEKWNFAPAACCCWRFHTDGTNQGDWYLPSIGELGYIPVRYDNINLTINALKFWSGIEDIYEVKRTTLWSSTMHSSNYTKLLDLTQDDLTHNNKFYSYDVRPFMKGTFPLINI